MKEKNSNIETVATKEGRWGAVISRHPNITNKEIYEGVKKALSKPLANNLISLPKHFEVEIAYRNFQRAHVASLFPGCTLKGSDRITFESDDYLEVLRMFKFNL